VNGAAGGRPVLRELIGALSASVFYSGSHDQGIDADHERRRPQRPENALRM
jgi:hypothetical protein